MRTKTSGKGGMFCGRCDRILWHFHPCEHRDSSTDVKGVRGKNFTTRREETCDSNMEHTAWFDGLRMKKLRLQLEQRHQRGSPKSPVAASCIARRRGARPGAMRCTPATPNPLPSSLLSFNIVVSNHPCPYGDGGDPATAVACFSPVRCACRSSDPVLATTDEGCPKASKACLQTPGLSSNPHRSSQKRSPFGEVMTGNPTRILAAGSPLRPSAAASGWRVDRSSPVDPDVSNIFTVASVPFPGFANLAFLAAALLPRAPLA